MFFCAINTNEVYNVSTKQCLEWNKKTNFVQKSQTVYEIYTALNIRYTFEQINSSLGLDIIHEKWECKCLTLIGIRRKVLKEWFFFLIFKKSAI